MKRSLRRSAAAAVASVALIATGANTVVPAHAATDPSPVVQAFLPDGMVEL